MDWFKWQFTVRDLPMAVLVVLLAIPEVKIFQVKPIEIFGLFSLLANARRLSKLELHLLLFFLGFLFLTMVQNIWMPFVEQKHSFPKTPYFISVVRFIEYLSCIGIVVYVRNHILTVFSIDYFIRRLALFCTIVNVVLVGIYLLDYFNLSESGLTYICGGRFRLRGFFFEGGPLGMFSAFMLILTLQFIKSKDKYLFSAIFLVIVGLSLSKAGAVAVIVYVGCAAIYRLYVLDLKIVPKYLIAIAILLLSFYFAKKLFSVYTDSLFNYEYLLKIASDNPQHFWINGGRVPGYYIIQEMFFKYPLFGIGIGNYQLLRDSEIYSAGFPVTQLWDYHGFGGIVDLVIQTGIVGFALFINILLKNLSKYRLIILGLFLIPFCFGTTLHFCYPWIILALGEKVK